MIGLFRWAALQVAMARRWDAVYPSNVMTFARVVLVIGEPEEARMVVFLLRGRLLECLWPGKGSNRHPCALTKLRLRQSARLKVDKVRHARWRQRRQVGQNTLQVRPVGPGCIVMAMLWSAAFRGR